MLVPSVEYIVSLLLISHWQKSFQLLMDRYTTFHLIQITVISKIYLRLVVQEILQQMSTRHSLLRWTRDSVFPIIGNLIILPVIITFHLRHYLSTKTTLNFICTSDMIPSIDCKVVSSICHPFLVP